MTHLSPNSLNVSGLIPAAQAIARQAATIYTNHTAPWFIGLIAHGSAVKGGVIPNSSDIDFQLYLRDDAFGVDGNLPLDVGIAIHRELAQIDGINLLSHGAGRLERHVRLHCTKVWPVLYQVVALQQTDPIRVWNLPKPAAIELLPPTSNLGQTIRAFDQAVRCYYPNEQFVADGLRVVETGMAFLHSVKRWWEEHHTI